MPKAQHPSKSKHPCHVAQVPLGQTILSLERVPAIGGKWYACAQIVCCLTAIRETDSNRDLGLQMKNSRPGLALLEVRVNNRACSSVHAKGQPKGCKWGAGGEIEIERLKPKGSLGM